MHSYCTNHIDYINTAQPPTWSASLIHPAVRPGEGLGGLGSWKDVDQCITIVQTVLTTLAQPSHPLGGLL